MVQINSQAWVPSGALEHRGEVMPWGLDGTLTWGLDGAPPAAPGRAC